MENIENMNNVESNDIKLLNKIYQNSTMGVNGTRTLRCKTECNTFKEALKEMEYKYDEFAGKAAKKLDELGQKPLDAKLLSKTMQWLNIQKNTLLNDSNRRIAETLILVSTNGVNDMIENIYDCADANDENRHLAEDLMHLEEHHINCLKVFLTH